VFNLIEFFSLALIATNLCFMHFYSEKARPLIKIFASEFFAYARIVALAAGR
jgi:hypothetical protein